MDKFRTTFLLCFILSPLTLMAIPAGRVVTTSNATLNGKELNSPSPVNTGDWILTKEDGRAKLLMIDQSVLDIGPKSKIKIGKYIASQKDESREVEMEMDFGSVRALVSRKKDADKSKYHFRTKFGVLGVRGTEVMLDILPNKGVRTLVSQGEAVFSWADVKLKPVTLKRGQILMDGVVSNWEGDKINQYREERVIADTTSTVAHKDNATKTAQDSSNKVLLPGSPPHGVTVKNPIERLKTKEFSDDLDLDTRGRQLREPEGDSGITIVVPGIVARGTVTGYHD